MKRGDFFLIGGVLILALGLFGWRLFSQEEGSQVVVRIDGQITAEYSLTEDRTVILNGCDGGNNTLEIADGTARMTEADCPDGLCVHQGEISYDGQTIVCLPHRIVVEIRGGENMDVDGLAR